MEEKFLHAEEPEAERNSPFRTRRSLNSTSGSKTFELFDVSLLKVKATFTREEKLKSKKIIEQLFKEGKSVSANGFTLVYLRIPLKTFYPAQVSFSVPKKCFKKAADRNRIKRLMREAYRLNKVPLYENAFEKKCQWAIMFVYKGKRMPDFDTTCAALTGNMKRLME